MKHPNFKKVVKLFLFIIFSANVFAEVPKGLNPVPSTKGKQVLPANVLKLNSLYSSHIAVVEKSTHRLHLYRNTESYPTFVKSYVIATGKSAGDKAILGDHKTPEGIYQFTHFVSKQDLLKRYGKEGEKYGAGAFVMNYPNPMDITKGKTGGGIWLHSTNDNSRIAKGLDSRGCVVVVDTDLMDIGSYIELNKTPIVIVQDLNFLREDTWERNRLELENLLTNWSKAWANENLNKYMSYYHKNEFYSSKGKFNDYRTYKKQVFWSKGKPTIGVSGTTILINKDYAFIQFQQDYSSAKINDTGRKTLYLKKNHKYEWKIVSEIWNKLPKASENEIVSLPSNRFFRE